MAISDQTTNFSNLSVEGRLSANTIQATSTFIGSILSSTGTVQGTLGVFSDVSSTNTARAATLLIGSATAGTAVTRIAKGTISVVAMTCIANASTTTAATVAGITTSDVVIVNPPSSLSSGIVLTAYASGNSTIDLIFSNCSTANQVVAAFTARYVAVRS